MARSRIHFKDSVMSYPYKYRYGLHCGLHLDLVLALVFIFHFHFVTSESLAISKTIKEELLPGFIIVNLATEPEFVRIVNYAKNNGTIRVDSSTRTGIQYSVLTSGNPNSQFFTVEPSSGIVSLKTRCDREQVCSFKDECHLNFEVAARSVYGVFFLLVNFYIVLTDINDNPPEFTQPYFELHVPENSERGRTFQLPTAFDRDTGVGNGVKEYRILEGPLLFGLKIIEAGVNTSDVFLTLENTVARENAPAHRILVGAIDGGLPSLTGTLTVEVHISDINDNFPVFEHSLYAQTIPEDTGKDQVIEQVKATDADVGLNGELRYAFSALQPQDDLKFFRIDAKTGEIFLTRSIESRTGDDIELVVEASDQGHPPKVSRTRVRFRVEDTINSMPDIIIDTLGGLKGMAEVSEYAEIGKVVAYISVRDPDSGDNGRTKCDLSDQAFGLVRLLDDGKYKAILAEKLDREKRDSYAVTVSCTDNGFPSLLNKASFTVKVLDENDHRPVFSQRRYEATVYENNTVGAVITKMFVRDEDIGKNAEISFDVFGTKKDFFDIDETGTVTAKIPLDREYSEKIVATVVATDRGTPPLSSSAALIVSLLDINDNKPEFSQAVYVFEVEEQQPMGRFIGIVSASDKDFGNNKEIVYLFPASHKQISNSFLVGADDGVMKTNLVLDREKKSSYNLVVHAEDKGVPPLTGTATCVIKVVDINDNDPYFVYPVFGNNTIFIPHTFQPRHKIDSVIAHDIDEGHNAAIIYSLNTVNDTAPFDINPTSGAIYLGRALTSKEVGVYTVILMASDQGPQQQRSTQTLLHIEVYFDNSTLFASIGTAGPSKEIIVAIVIISVILLIGIVICVTIICLKRHKAKRKQNGVVPSSASTSSTTKLHGGYYIAPGVRGSSSSFIGSKQVEGASNNPAQDTGEGNRNTNSYVVLVPRPEAERPSEIIQITRNGYHNGLNDTLNTLDLDHTDDGQFSTFKSQEDILSPGLRQGSLRKQNYTDHDSSIAKKSNDTFDDLSCDGSTSDSGRGGSDMDVNSGAAASKNDKARAQAATPISLKSGISHRLSPLLQKEKTFATFRGESPNSFKFDSDSDTLTRSTQRSRASPMPATSSLSRKGAPRFDPSSALSGPAGLVSESDTDSEHTLKSHPQHRLINSAGVCSPRSQSVSSSKDSPHMLTTPVTSIPPPTYPRRDSETDYSDTGSNPSGSLTRRNHIPRLPLYPGIEFTHHAFGVPNRNSAFSNNSFSLNSDILSPDYDQWASGSNSIPMSHNGASSLDYNSMNSRHGSSGGRYISSSNPSNSLPDAAGTSNYGNSMSRFHDSRPISIEEDFLLPPYPEVDEEDEENLNIHPGFSEVNPQRDAERALVPKSRYESSA